MIVASPPQNMDLTLWKSIDSGTSGAAMGGIEVGLIDQ